MKFDQIIAGMVPTDVEAVLSFAFRDHLSCECVDHRDVDVHCDHLAHIVIEVMAMEDNSPEYNDFADMVLKRGKYDNTNT